MSSHDHSIDEVVQDFCRQIINAIIEVCNAGGDTAALATIASNLETLREPLKSTGELADDIFPNA